MTADMMTELSATGGVLLLGIALSSLLEIKISGLGTSCRPGDCPAFGVVVALWVFNYLKKTVWFK
jgi:hypothetical protein